MLSFSHCCFSDDPGHIYLLMVMQAAVAVESAVVVTLVTVGGSFCHSGGWFGCRGGNNKCRGVVVVMVVAVTAVAGFVSCCSHYFGISSGHGFAAVAMTMMMAIAAAMVVDSAMMFSFRLSI